MGGSVPGETTMTMRLIWLILVMIPLASAAQQPQQPSAYEQMRTINPGFARVRRDSMRMMKRIPSVQQDMNSAANYRDDLANNFPKPGRVKFLVEQANAAAKGKLILRLSEKCLENMEKLLVDRIAKTSDGATPHDGTGPDEKVEEGDEHDEGHGGVKKIYF